MTRTGMIESYAGRTVLITGGAGFIGSALVSALNRISCRLVLLLRPGRIWEPMPDGRAEIVPIHGDIQKRETWRKALEGVDHVFHLAAQTSSYIAHQDPLADLQANVVPVLQMLEACREGGLKPAILFAGTSTQTGMPKELPVDEQARDLPVTVYDIHKLVGEKYLQCYSSGAGEPGYASETGIPAVTLRLSNVYGPGTNVGSADRGFLNQMVKNGLNKKPLTVYGDGRRVRDYIFIKDVVSAFLTAGICAANLSGNYYVIGSGEGFRIVDAINLVAGRVELMLGYRPQIQHVPTPDGQTPIEARDFIADTGLFNAATGWASLVSLADGIDRTIDYLLSQTPVHSEVSL